MLVALVIGALGALGAAAPAQAVVSASPVTSATFNGGVYALAVRGTTVFIGGNFTSATYNGHHYARQRLAAVDAATGALLDWAPTADAAVRALAVDGSAVYAAGDFAYVGGLHRDGVARLDASTGAVGAFKHSVLGAPKALGVGHGLLYVAGHLTGVDGKVRANTAAFSLTTGTLVDSWAPATDDTVESLAVTADRVYLGGSFHRTNDVSSTTRLVAVDPDTGVLDLTFRPKPVAVVHGVTAGPAGVYAAIGGQGGRAVGYGFDGTEQWNLTTDGDVQAVAVLAGKVYFGGHFDNVCATVNNGAHGVCTDGSLVRVKLGAAGTDGTLDAWSPNGNGIHGVFALAPVQANGRLAAGGEFTTIGGVSRPRFALFS
jgi:hypothetical protein